MVKSDILITERKGNTLTEYLSIPWGLLGIAKFTTNNIYITIQLPSKLTFYHKMHSENAINKFFYKIKYEN